MTYFVRFFFNLSKKKWILFVLKSIVLNLAERSFNRVQIVLFFVFWTTLFSQNFVRSQNVCSFTKRYPFLSVHRFIQLTLCAHKTCWFHYTRCKLDRLVVNASLIHQLDWCDFNTVQFLPTPWDAVPVQQKINEQTVVYCVWQIPLLNITFFS